MTRGELIRAKREDLVRFANWLRLRIGDDWSNRHIASLIYWKITRAEKRRRNMAWAG